MLFSFAGLILPKVARKTHLPAHCGFLVKGLAQLKQTAGGGVGNLQPLTFLCPLRKDVSVSAHLSLAVPSRSF